MKPNGMKKNPCHLAMKEGGRLGVEAKADVDVVSVMGNEIGDPRATKTVGKLL